MIVNLVVNARDAMPNGGKLSMVIANRALCVGDFPWVEAGGEFVSLSVTDTGTGMSEAVQQRIFDPFFTTKEAGKGTGLGLSTVLGIVKQSRGHVTVDSRIGVGTTFTAYFPRHAEPARRTPAAGVMSVMPATHRPAPARTVLVIDDEPAICSALVRMLGREGYVVLVAQDAASARRLAFEQPGIVELILADIMVPGINGRDLVDEVLLMQPEARVIFMSGFSDDAVKLQGILDKGTPFIAKPFTMDEIVRKVNEALRGVPGAVPRPLRFRKASRT